MRSLLVALVACTCVPVGLSAGEPTGEPGDGTAVLSKETRRLVETIASGQDLRVVNPFGDVYARFGGYEGQVEVLATCQRLEAELPELQITLNEAATGLDVTVAPEAPLPDAITRDRVDLVIFVPEGTHLDVRTRDGRIEAKKLHGPMTASSVSGDIRLTSIGGRLNAKTARGRMTVTLASGATSEPQELVTETGDIEAWLAADAHAEVSLATSGEICTDFSITIEHRDFEEPNKTAAATLGRGGSALALRSKQGRVCLRRLQQRFRPEG